MIRLFTCVNDVMLVDDMGHFTYVNKLRLSFVNDARLYLCDLCETLYLCE